MHIHDEKNNNGMMWMMVLCCVLPLLLVGIFGAGGKAISAPTWLIFAGIIVMVVVHFVMMRKTHKHSDVQHDVTDTDTKKQHTKNDTSHSEHGNCH